MSDTCRMTKGTEIRDERITIRIPKSLRTALDKEAAAQMRTVSDVIILCLIKSLGVKPKAKRARKGGR